MVFTQACINIRPKKYNRLANRLLKSLTYHNTDFDKSYGFCLSMKKHIVRPQKVL